MNALVSIFLASIVMISTSGVGITTHFCGNRVASVSMLGDGGCSCGVMDDAEGCCSTEREFFQVEEDFSVIPVQTLKLAASSILSVFVYHLSFEFLESDKLVAHENYRPPVPDKDILVLIQSFLI